MVRDRVEAVKMFRVDVRVVFVLFASGVVSDIERLVVEVVGVSYSMLVVTLVPDFCRGVLTGCEGVSALDVLNALCR
jgi:hypothetical protein